MFHVHLDHQSPLGTVKRSRVERAATFTGVTAGLAIKYVATGREYYRVGKETPVLGAGELLLLPAGTPYHAHVGTQAHATTGLCIDLYGEFPREPGFAYLFGGIFHAADLGLHSLADWRRQPLMPADADMAGIRRETIAFLRRAATVGERLSASARQPRTRRDLSRGLLAAHAYVSRHSHQPLSLDQLCRIAGLSKFHFSRLFRQAFGYSPLELQSDLRLRRALVLLGRDCLTVTDIAYQLGYADLASFSRRFRQRYGVPPSRWRGAAGK